MIGPNVRKQVNPGVRPPISSVAIAPSGAGPRFSRFRQALKRPSRLPNPCDGGPHYERRTFELFYTTNFNSIFYRGQKIWKTPIELKLCTATIIPEPTSQPIGHAPSTPKSK
jgi:hypothetical protein